MWRRLKGRETVHVQVSRRLYLANPNRPGNTHTETAIDSVCGTTVSIPQLTHAPRQLYIHADTKIRVKNAYMRKNTCMKGLEKKTHTWIYSIK